MFPRPIVRKTGLLALAALAVASMPFASATHTTTGLTNEGCAITKGGWGGDPNGHNPGALLHAWFDDLFPDGLTVGDLFFEDAQDVTDYLPNEGFSNVEEQAVALALNIAFGEAGLLNGTINNVRSESTNTTLDNKTAVEILEIAEAIILSDSTPSESEYSDLVLVMTRFNEEFFGCAPECPADLGLVATANGDGSVSLNWDDVAGVDEYNVYRAEGAGALVLLDTVSESAFLDTSTMAGVTYTYAVTLVDDGRESPICDRAEVTAIPFFGALGAALAALGAVAAIVVARRR